MCRQQSVHGAASAAQPVTCSLLTAPSCLCRIVAVLERVQGGVIGRTLSTYGITGLYITVVIGLGRILRNRTRGLRMRIPFEDLPSTLRLLALCQVCRAAMPMQLHIRVLSPMQHATCRCVHRINSMCS